MQQLTDQSTPLLEGSRSVLRMSNLELMPQACKGAANLNNSVLIWIHRHLRYMQIHGPPIYPAFAAMASFLQFL